VGWHGAVLQALMSAAIKISIRQQRNLISERDVQRKLSVLPRKHRDKIWCMRTAKTFWRCLPQPGLQTNTQGQQAPSDTQTHVVANSTPCSVPQKTLALLTYFALLLLHGSG
jgi:hypothetical protein